MYGINDEQVRLARVIDDLHLAMSALTFYIEIGEPTDEIERQRAACYLNAAISSYVRPFSTESGQPPLTLEEIGIELSEETGLVHQQALTSIKMLTSYPVQDERSRRIKYSEPFDDCALRMPSIVGPRPQSINGVTEWRALLSKIIAATAELVWRATNASAMASDHRPESAV